MDSSRSISFAFSLVLMGFIGSVGTSCKRWGSQDKRPATGVRSLEPDMLFNPKYIETLDGKWPTFVGTYIFDKVSMYDPAVSDLDRVDNELASKLNILFGADFKKVFDSPQNKDFPFATVWNLSIKEVFAKEGSDFGANGIQLLEIFSQDSRFKTLFDKPNVFFKRDKAKDKVEFKEIETAASVTLGVAKKQPIGDMLQTQNIRLQTLGDHTKLVFEVLQANRSSGEAVLSAAVPSLKNTDERPNPLAKNLGELLQVVLALHDIGKPFALVTSDNKAQHTFTSLIALNVMHAIGYSRSELMIAHALINHDLLGGAVWDWGQVPSDYFEHGDPGKAARAESKDALSYKADFDNGVAAARSGLSKLADVAGLAPEAFRTLQLLYFTADAGAYAENRISRDGEIDVSNPRVDAFVETLNSHVLTLRFPKVWQEITTAR